MATQFPIERISSGPLWYGLGAVERKANQLEWM
jgi:hypothetical protein